MVKSDPIPCTKEEVNGMINEAQANDDFDYMLLMVLKKTGRRIGELYGVQDVKELKKKVVGKRTIYYKGEPIEIDRTIPQYKRLKNWSFGVKIKDIDLEKGIMKTWVLKRRKYIQDETILRPEVVRIIKSYIKRNQLGLEDYLFRRKGRSYRQILNVVKMYAKKAGVKHNVSVHNFRHYFITELKRKGWTNDMIMKVTGHKTAEVLTIYDHVLATDIKEKILEDTEDI